jgi:tRNA G37 N-methylase TrmD
MQYKELVARMQHGVVFCDNSHQPSSYLSLHFSHDKQHFQHKHHQVQRSILGRVLTGDHKGIVGWHNIQLAESRPEVGLFRWRRTDTETLFWRHELENEFERAAT